MAIYETDFDGRKIFSCGGHSMSEVLAVKRLAARRQV
jgi:hypothetical protein